MIQIKCGRPTFRKSAMVQHYHISLSAWCPINLRIHDRIPICPLLSPELYKHKKGLTCLIRKSGSTKFPKFEKVPGEFKPREFDVQTSNAYLKLDHGGLVSDENSDYLRLRMLKGANVSVDDLCQHAHYEVATHSISNSLGLQMKGRIM